MEKSHEINHFYLSAREYAGRTGLGYRDVLYQCERGLFDCFLTEGGQWRIKVLKHENSKEIERLTAENIRLKSVISNAICILNETLNIPTL